MLDRFAVGLGIFMLFVTVGLIFVNSSARVIVILPAGWIEDVVVFMVAWSVFLMLGPVAKRDEHIRVGFLVSRVLGEKKAETVWTAVENIIGLGFASLFAFYGYEWVVFSYDQHLIRYSPGGFWYAVWIVRIAVPLGMSILAFLYLERTIRQLMLFITRRRNRDQVLSSGEIEE
ncbi:TRAP transporter small permease [Chloroflexota bacterium]